MAADSVASKDATYVEPPAVLRMTTNTSSSGSTASKKRRRIESPPSTEQPENEHCANKDGIHPRVRLVNSMGKSDARIEEHVRKLRAKSPRAPAASNSIGMNATKVAKTAAVVKELKQRLKQTQRWETTAKHLFQFSRKLHRTQYITDEVRARELQEKHAALVSQREALEQKIRSKKREIAHLHGELEACGRQLNQQQLQPFALSLQAPQPPSVVLERDVSTTTTVSSTTRHSIDGSFLAPVSEPVVSSNVENIQTQIRETLRVQWASMRDYMKDTHGIQGLSEKIARLR